MYLVGTHLSERTAMKCFPELRTAEYLIGLKLFGVICFTVAKETSHHGNISYSLPISQNDEGQGESNRQELRELALTEHNKLRKDHGVPDLKQDEQLHRLAQKYAQHLAATEKFDHSTDNDFGENLMQTSAEDEAESVTIAVASWYEEIDDYDFKKPGYANATAHFTEMIWKANTHVGIGIAWNSKEEQYVVVANYRPGGNVEEEYVQNVPPRRVLDNN